MVTRVQADVGRPTVRALTGGLAAGLVAFQVGLAAGAPWGRFAWGGQHPSVLPNRLRAASAASALIWAGSVVAVARPSAPSARRALRGYAGLAALGTVLNAASQSPAERALWTPVAGGLAVGFWRLSRPAPAWGAGAGRHTLAS